MFKKISAIALGLGFLFSIPAEASHHTEDLIKTAKQYQGVPYVWGGTTPNGFDCSGYLQYVFAKEGVKIPRTVAQIYRIGESVSRTQLQRGDLVFFETYQTGASHAGIYLGDNRFIHSGSSNGVSVSSMGNPYWSPRYIGAKRVLDEPIQLEDWQFFDVSEKHWAYEPITTFTKKGLVNGFSDRHFRPNQELTRAQAAVIITNALGIQPSDEKINYNDISKNHWAYLNIRAATDAGIFVGDNEGNFRPNDVLTRAQLSVVLDRVYRLKTSDNVESFIDVDRNHWAYSSIKNMRANGIVGGFGDNTYRPNESTTRAQFVAVMNRLEN